MTSLFERLNDNEIILPQSTDIKHTLVAILDRTGMSVSQVSDEVLFTGLI